MIENVIVKLDCTYNISKKKYCTTFQKKKIVQHFKKKKIVQYLICSRCLGDCWAKAS